VCLRRGRTQWEGGGKLAGRQAGDELTERAASRSPAREPSWVLATLQRESKWGKALQRARILHIRKARRC